MTKRSASNTRRRPWLTPALDSLGPITKLVQGAGKIGTQDDGDPQSTSKTGGG